MEAQIITGTIVSIEDASRKMHPKKIAEIAINEKEIVYVEFRNHPMIERLLDFKILDKVQMAIKYEGKTSRGFGNRFNNIYAKTIKKA